MRLRTTQSVPSLLPPSAASIEASRLANSTVFREFHTNENSMRPMTRRTNTGSNIANSTMACPFSERPNFTTSRLTTADSSGCGTFVSAPCISRLVRSGYFPTPRASGRDACPQVSHSSGARKRRHARKAHPGFFEDIRRLAEREADQVPPELAAREERRSGYTGDTYRTDEPVGECDVVIETERANIAEDVIRTLWSVRAQASGIEDAHQMVPPSAVLGREPFVIVAAHLERDSDSLLQQCGRADGD